MRKQTEGDNRQRRAAAKQARSEGRAPSAAGVTTGASKQRHHVAAGDHEDRTRNVRDTKLPSVGQGVPKRKPGSGEDKQPG
jgi:hypothetical protein